MVGLFLIEPDPDYCLSYPFPDVGNSVDNRKTIWKSCSQSNQILPEDLYILNTTSSTF